MITNIYLIILLGIVTCLLIIVTLCKCNTLSSYKGKISKSDYCSMVCKDCSNIKVAILFTIYNTKDRENMYKDVLEYWVKDCKLPKDRVFIVDSSNRGVDTSMIPLKNQVIFNQKQVCFNFKNQTELELCSLAKAVEELDFGDVTHVFKITGKYKLPELCDLTFNSDLIVQSENKNLLSFFNRSINTEIFGVRLNLFKYIINSLEKSKGNSMENRLYKIIKENSQLSVQYLPKLINDGRYKRNAGSYISYL